MRGRPFEAGKSGNPAGRPKGLEARVRELIEVGEIVEFLLGVMRGSGEDKDRLKAADMLLDRGFGKPRADVDLTVAGELDVNQRLLDVSKLTTEQLEVLAALDDEHEGET